jgi:hypothetical protein
MLDLVELHCLGDLGQHGSSRPVNADGAPQRARVLALLLSIFSFVPFSTQ